MRRAFILAFLFALVVSCALGQSSHYSYGVRVSDVITNPHYPGKMEEWQIGEIDIKDQNAPNRLITGIAENGSRARTPFPFRMNN